MAPTERFDPFPKPNLAVDLAILTVYAGARTLQPVGDLCVLVLDQGRGRRVLPGRFVREQQTIAQAIEAVLTEKVGITPDSLPRPKLLGVYDDPARDARGWTMSVAHSMALPAEQLRGTAAELMPVDDRGRLATGEHLAYDHDKILVDAVAALRHDYELAPDPGRMLDAPFTLSQLRLVHEAVLGERLLKDTFNRRMSDQLEELREDGQPVTLRSIGRPARLFVRRPELEHSGIPWQLPRASDDEPLLAAGSPPRPMSRMPPRRAASRPARRTK